jgi:hypothetical protein
MIVASHTDSSQTKSFYARRDHQLSLLFHFNSPPSANWLQLPTKSAHLALRMVDLEIRENNR